MMPLKNKTSEPKGKDKESPMTGSEDFRHYKQREIALSINPTTTKIFPTEQQKSFSQAVEYLKGKL